MEKPLSLAERRRLSRILDDSRPGGVTLSKFDGLVCGIAVGPTLVPPSAWLPLVLGYLEMDESDDFARVTTLLFRHYNGVVDAVARDRYTPIFDGRPTRRYGNRAQAWAEGFLAAIGLDPAWNELLEDEKHRISLVPIMTLVESSATIEGGLEDPRDAETFVDFVPLVIPIIRSYWTDTRRRRSRKGSRRAVVRTAADLRPASRVAAPVAGIHRLKVTLRHVRPVVWRRIELPSDTPLVRVSRIVLSAMGWDDSHLHAFRTGRGEATDGVRDERRRTLADLAPAVGDTFAFDYDFGDGWSHEVRVEAVTTSAESTLRCLSGRGACPPEDCGGPSGYADLREALRDPDHESHDEMTAWIGKDFDPAAFDLSAANARLTKIAKKAGRRST